MSSLWSRVIAGRILMVLAAGLCGASFLAHWERWHWRLALFAHPRPQYFVALLLAAGAFLLLRQRKWAVICAFGASLNVPALCSHFVADPRQFSPASDAPGLRLMTFNLLQGNERPDDVIALVRRERPDIAAFQEVTRAWAAKLKELEDLYPHRVIRQRDEKFGCALFARATAVENVAVIQPRPGEPNSFVSATLQLQDRQVIVGVAHLHKPTSQNSFALQGGLLQRVQDWALRELATGKTVILLGDFNVTPWSYRFRDFVAQTGLRDSSQGHVFTATWHRWRPDQLMLDHIFLSPGCQYSRRHVGPPLGSDHRPVLLDVTLN